MTDKEGFRLADHPWLSLTALILVSVLVLIATATIAYGVLALPRRKGSGARFWRF